MKLIDLGTEIKPFKENYKKALMEFYEDKTEIVAEDDTIFIFKIPFSDKYYFRAKYDLTTVAIGTESDISGTDINADFVFNKDNARTTLTLLILKDNSITLLEEDSQVYHGGTSLYSIANTDKGLIFFSYSERPSDIRMSKSVCVETGKDLTPLMFGNQYVNKDNEVLKHPLRFTDTDGVIYTCKDIYNISYKSDSFTALPNSFISSVGGANKIHPDEKFVTSILIYNEES